MIMEKQKVIVTDIKMSFWSMVMFMVKWTIASIPAFIILVVILITSFAIVYTVLQKVMPGLFLEG